MIDWYGENLCPTGKAALLEQWMFRRIAVVVHLESGQTRPGQVWGEAWNPAMDVVSYWVIFTDTPPSAFMAMVNNEPIGFEAGVFEISQLEEVVAE